MTQTQDALSRAIEYLHAPEWWTPDKQWAVYVADGGVNYYEAFATRYEAIAFADDMPEHVEVASPEDDPCDCVECNETEVKVVTADLETGKEMEA